MTRPALAALLAAVLSGCAAVGDYLSDRGGDLVDTARAKLLFGFGLGVKAEATPFVHVGALWHDSWALGLHDRGVGHWDERVASWGLIVGHHAERTEGLPRFSGSYGWTLGDGFDWPDERNRFVDALSVRLAAMGVLLGIDVQVRLGELLVDFPAGLVGLDPSGDDG